MKDLFLRTNKSAAFHYRIQLIKIPSAFLLRRIFNHLVGAVALAALAAAATASAAESTIPIIVKDTTSGFWQIVLAGARKAGKDLGVKVPELGAQSEADINGQVPHIRRLADELEKISLHRDWIFGSDSEIRNPQPAGLDSYRLERDSRNLAQVLKAWRDRGDQTVFDRLIEFNGVNIETDSMNKLTERFSIDRDQPVQLLVCSPATYAHYKSNKKLLHSNLETVKRLKPVRDTDVTSKGTKVI